jgi:hypothetical protein
VRLRSAANDVPSVISKNSPNLGVEAAVPSRSPSRTAISAREDTRRYTRLRVRDAALQTLRKNYENRKKSLPSFGFNSGSRARVVTDP